MMTPDRTAYGCVREIALIDSLLTVSLEPGCLDDLEIEDAEIEALLDVPADSIDRVREVLVKVLSFGSARRVGHPISAARPTKPRKCLALCFNGD
ncbi:hypothetical protein ACFQ9Z_35885 [Streptomyces sp. NPDC056580]|uniref:hypothetical protein n=1 Tax=Streptomyces sp. NPDC056580 TaxID=3345872 RepID=UPI0036C12258